MPNPWDNDPVVGGSSPFGSRPVIQQQPDPYRQRDQALQEEAARRAAEDQRRQEAKDQRDQLEWNATHNQDGSPKAGANKDPKVTEGERASAGYYRRAVNAHQQYGKGILPRSPIAQFGVDLLPDNFENKIDGPERRAANNYADEFIRAKLRKESGAAIGVDEMEREYRTYFAVPGDEEADLERKAALRQQAIEALRIASGSEADNAIQGLQAPQPEKKRLTPEQQQEFFGILEAQGPDAADAYLKQHGLSLKSKEDAAKPHSKGLEYVPGKAVENLKKTSGPAGITDLVVHGATLGLSDEAAGVGNALANVVTSPFTGNFDPVSAYSTGTEAERQRLTEAKQRYGVGGTVAEIGGSLASGNVSNALAVAPSLIGRMAQGARAGAAGGGIAGFGYGEGQNSLLTAAGGAAGGAALGGALPVAGQFVGDRVQAVRRLTGRDPDLPRNIVGEAMAADGLTPPQAGARMDEAHSRGAPMMLADTGENQRQLLASVGRQPGPSRTITKNAVIERQHAQAERIGEAVARDLGPTANIREMGDELIDRAKAAAAPLYEKAYATQVPQTPKLQTLLNTPAGRAALSRARTIAANEQRDPTSLGFALDDKGDVVLRPTNMDMLHRQAAARTGLRDAQNAYRRARKGSDGDMQKASDAIEAARGELRAADSELSAAPSPETAQTVPTYTTHTLDYIKRGLDDIIEQHRDPVTGRLILDEAGRAINGVKNGFLAEIDRLNPAYKSARAAYAGPAKMRDALEKGVKSLSKSPDDIMAMMKDLGDSEKEAFRLGVRKAIVELVGSKKDGGDKVSALLGTPKARAALSRVFGGKAEFERFVATLRDEEAMGHTYKAVAGNSMTAERSAQDAGTSDSGLADAAIGAAVSGNPTGLIASAITKLRDVNRFGAGEAGQRTRESVAALLTETDPALLRELIREAQRAAARQQGLAVKRGKNVVRTGRNAGNLTGMGSGSLQQPQQR